MKEVFTFYRAVDPMKGSWDGYGCFPIGNDFLAFVTDAPSGASIHTPELIKEFWRRFSDHAETDFPEVQLADALNRLQNDLQLKSRRENTPYQATLAIARKLGSHLYYCCIGDSVLQIYRGGKLYRLSESEVWDGALIVGSGQRTQERQKTQEIRFIGSNGQFIEVSEISEIELKNEDLLLFYTDGVEDLLPPDRLLQILASDRKELRPQFEIIFAQDKVKDDATILAVEAQVANPFQAEKEIDSLRSQIERLRKEQSEVRSQLTDFTATRNRLEKMETSVSQITQELKRAKKTPQPQPGFATTTPTSGRGVSARKKQPALWLVALLFLLVGTAAGAFLFRGKEQRTSGAAVKQPTVVLPREVAPPEIPSAADCTYIIQKGDSLEKIATANNITVDQLLLLNPGQKKQMPLLFGKTLNVCKEGS